MNKENIREHLPIIFLVLLFILLSSQGHPKILGMWEGSVIYNIFHPGELPNYFPIIQKGADTVGNHGFDYNMLALTRIFADYFGHSISVIKFLPITYGFFTLFLLYIVVRRWFGWLIALISVLILMTNQYFLILSNELVASSTLTTMIILLLIERYQNIEIHTNKLSVASFAFVCAIACTNYILVRLIMISIIIFYTLDINSLIKNSFNFGLLINKKRIKITMQVLIIMVIFLFIFFPANIKYLFNSNFIFPMTDEYAKGAVGALSSIYYNSIYIINYYIVGDKSLSHSTNLFVDIPYPIDSSIILILAFIGIVFSLIHIKDNKYLFLLYISSIIFFLCLLSDLNPENKNISLEILSTMNHYRIFSLVLFSSIFAAVVIVKIILFLKNYNYRFSYIFYSLLIILFVYRINDYLNEINRFNYFIDNYPFNIYEPAINKSNPLDSFGNPNDLMAFDKRKDFHINHIYFYKLSMNIEEQIKNSGEDKGILYINPDYFTPDYYRMGGGDIPFKGYPYYFQMYLTFYLQNLGINSSYLVEKDYVSSSMLKKIIKIVDRYKKHGRQQGQYPHTDDQEKNVLIADKIITLIKKLPFGKIYINKIVEKEHYYENVKKHGDYYLNITSRKEPEYIIVINKKELDVITSSTGKKTLVNLQGY